MKPYYEHAGIRIFHGDCREILPTLKAELVLTDPPYGVGLGSKARSSKMSKHGSGGYASCEDNGEHVISELCLPALDLARACSRWVVLTPGTMRLFMYPEPDALWCLHWPNGAGIGRWKSFTCWQPVLCYGPPPPRVGCFPDTFTTTEQADANGHPCPKPIGIWRRLADRIWGEGTILDPFMGSGTTLRAAKDLGRKAIGIEIEERYCEIAAKRLAQEVLPFA